MPSSPKDTSSQTIGLALIGLATVLAAYALTMRALADSDAELPDSAGIAFFIGIPCAAVGILLAGPERRRRPYRRGPAHPQTRAAAPSAARVADDSEGPDDSDDGISLVPGSLPSPIPRFEPIPDLDLDLDPFEGSADSDDFD